MDLGKCHAPTVNCYRDGKPRQSIAQPCRRNVGGGIGRRIDHDGYCPGFTRYDRHRVHACDAVRAAFKIPRHHGAIGQLRQGCVILVIGRNGRSGLVVKNRCVADFDIPATNCRRIFRFRGIGDLRKKKARSDFGKMICEANVTHTVDIIIFKKA